MKINKVALDRHITGNWGEDHPSLKPIPMRSREELEALLDWLHDESTDYRGSFPEPGYITSRVQAIDLLQWVLNID